MEKEKKNEFHLPEYYENRELSWLKFDARVLNEAKDKSIPLLERLKFVSITSSNLDEFFMVRVASLKDMVHADYRKRDIAGMLGIGAARPDQHGDQKTRREPVQHV